MRPLSRLLSVFIALILMGVSLGAVSANEDATADHEDGSVDHVRDLTINPADSSYPNYGARVVISRVDGESPVYPGTTLKFRVLIIRGNHNIPAHGPDQPSVANEDGTFLVRSGDEDIVEVPSDDPDDPGTNRIDYITGADFADRGDDDTADDLVGSCTLVRQGDRLQAVRPTDLGSNATSRNAPNSPSRWCLTRIPVR